MSYHEQDIAYETPKSWVLRDKKRDCYTVFRVGVTHSESDSSYPLDDDGLSIAKAYADYINKAQASARTFVNSTTKGIYTGNSMSSPRDNAGLPSVNGRGV